MANRPIRNKTKPTRKLSQSEINRIKPVGTLTVDVLRQKSALVSTINVKLPDGEVYEFYHLPMTLADARDFDQATSEDRLTAIRDNVHTRLVKKDGSPFVDDPEVWETVDVKIIDVLCRAMLESAREEGGED